MDCVRKWGREKGSLVGETCGFRGFPWRWPVTKISKSREVSLPENLQLEAPINYYNRDWLTWVFKSGTSEQCRLFCCGLWVLWTSRYQLVHESRNTSGNEILKWILSYVKEFDGLEARKLTNIVVEEHWKPLPSTNLKINFDTSFDSHWSRSGSRLVVQDVGVGLWLRKLYFIKQCPLRSQQKHMHVYKPFS
ncbi:hypothetical protein PVK06_010838 [Gossypium arboreum]|uniref:Uncharacterized protein n=1 Tax=Gossypium arboreum TaxID=29729 RepID=A0ABR0Q7D7_GOSAR|nr:hypothetical protein PVK06_010838 [Gossypium arboreum]